MSASSENETPEQAGVAQGAAIGPTKTALSSAVKQDDATVLADTPHALSPGTIEKLESEDKLAHVGRNSISPAALDADPAFREVDKQGKPLPIYVMPDTGDQKPGAVIVDMGNGKQVVMANEGIHDWNRDYLDRHVMKSDEAVASEPDYISSSKYTPETPDARQRYQELLAHIADTAKNNGIGEAHVLIGSEAGVKDAYNFTSKEGTDYIVIPEAELSRALSTEETTRKLGSVIDEHVPDIKKGENSPEALLARHEGDQYIAGLTVKDKITLPKSADDPMLSAAAVREMVYEKSFIEIKKSDLNPGTAAAVSGGSIPADMPIYLVAGQNSDYKVDGPVQILRTKEGKEYALVDEKLHVWNEDYVKQHVMNSETDMARFELNGSSMRPEPALARELHTPDDVQILVNTDDTVTTAYALQTKEGKNYIIIPKEDAAAAMHSEGEMQRLQQSVDAQAEEIRKGNTSPAGLIKADEADRWMAENIPVKDGRQFLPAEDTSVSNQVLDTLAQSGRFVECKRSDLTPGAADFLAHAKDAEGKPLPDNVPVYLVPGINSDGIDAVGGQLMKTAEGKSYILVNEKAHKWTESDAQVQPSHNAVINADISTPSHPKGLSTAESALKDELKGKSPQDAAAIQRRYKELTGAAEKYSSNMGISNRILIDNSTEAQHTYAPTGASSITSKEKTNYIFMTREEFHNALSSDAGLANESQVMGHETTHNYDQHSSTRGVLEAHDLAKSREHEMQADLGGCGPLGTRHPLAQAKVYEEFLRDKYYEQHPDQNPPVPRNKLGDKELEQVSAQLVKENYDPQHPSRWELIVALRHEASLMKDYETNYKKEHGHPISAEPPEVQKKIRMEESEQVVDQTMDYMKDKKQWPTQDPAPEIKGTAPANTPDSVAKSEGGGQEAPTDKTRQSLDNAKALFQKHCRQGCSDVDTSVAGFVPSAAPQAGASQQRDPASLA